MDSTSLRDHVAAEVRAQLARRRVSARQAAFSLGWTEHYMSRRLTGKIAFDVDDLATLAGLLDVPVTVFFEGPNLGDSAYTGGLLTERVKSPYHVQHWPDLDSCPTLPAAA